MLATHVDSHDLVIACTCPSALQSLVSALYSQAATAQTAAYWGWTLTTLSTQNKNSAHFPLGHRSGVLVYVLLLTPTSLHLYIVCIVIIVFFFNWIVLLRLSTMCISSGCFSCVYAVVCHCQHTVAYCLHRLLSWGCCGGFKGENQGESLL